MTTQPPYLGHTEGKAATPSTDFGATTVSGSPSRTGAAPAAPSGAPTATHDQSPVPNFAPGVGPTLETSPGLIPIPTQASGSTPSAKPGRAAGARGPRRARLQLRHIDPWTVLKFSCVLSIALFFVWMIVVGVLFGVLDGAGVINKINHAANLINGPGSKPPVSAGLVFGGAAIIGVVNIVLFIALSTIGSVVYNLCADLVGGVELTLSER